MCLQCEKRSSNFMYLMVEFPRVKTNDKEYSIVYYEKVITRSSAHTRCILIRMVHEAANWLDHSLPLRTETTPHPSPPAATLSKFLTPRWRWWDSKKIYQHNCRAGGKNSITIFFVVSLQENLVESKHHKLARSLRSGPSDHDLKPNAATRDQLNVRNLCK